VPDGDADQHPEADRDQHGQLALVADGLGQRVRAGDADQHQDEQEQHHDRAGVDDDLHDAQEVGALGQVEDREADHGHRQRQRGVHGLLGEDHPQRAEDRDDRQDVELERLAAAGPGHAVREDESGAVHHSASCFMSVRCCGTVPGAAPWISPL